MELSDSLKVDRKDCRILEILAQNCRISNAAIASTLSVSKDTVVYRMRRLESSELLQQYVLFVDARPLGFTRYHFLIRFKRQLEDESPILKAISSHPAVMWVNTFLGRYDVQVIVDAEDGAALNAIREDLFRVSEHKMSEYSVLTHLCDLEFTQLNPILDLGTRCPIRKDHSFSDVLTRRRFPVGMEFKRYTPDLAELDILRLLANDPKMGISDIAEKAGCDRMTVRKKILSLIQNKIILSFGGIPNLPHLGFVTYYLLVRLQQDTSVEVMRRPFKTLRNIFYAGRMVGDYDMILYLNARNPVELEESIRLFKRDIGGHIIHYDLLIQDRVHHWRQFTPYLYERCRKKLK